MRAYFSEGKFLGDIRFWFIILILFLGIVTWKSCNKPHKVDSIPNLEYKEPEKTYVDEHAKEHNQQTTESVTTQVLDRLVDSLISENKNLKKAISLVQASTRIDTVFREKIRWIDTISGEFEIAKKDQWIDLSAKGNIKTGEGSISIKTWDTLSVVMRRKNNLFKPDEIIADVSFSSPYNQVDKMRSYSVSERKSILVIGPQASFGWDGNKWRPSVGIGVTYNLFSIKTRK